MKIVDVRIHQVIVPMRPGVVHSEGVEDKLCAPDPVTGRSLNFWEFPKWIIELEADNGLIGLGEPRRGDLYGPLREHADLIIGKELIDLPIGNLPLPHTDDYDSYFIYEAYEMAWLDLLGKHLGVPVHHLLGGKKIDRVPVDFWMGRGTPEDTAARAQTGLDLGFRGMKMKCMLGDPIAERVAAVREVAPHFPIVLDPNERFLHPEGTREVSRSLEGLDRVTFESPMPQDRLDWYVEVRGTIPQLVALHLTSITDLVPAVRAEAADCYNLLGPLKEFVEWATLTRKCGLPTWRGTGVDLGGARHVERARRGGGRVRAALRHHRQPAARGRPDRRSDPVRGRRAGGAGRARPGGGAGPGCAGPLRRAGRPRGRSRGPRHELSSQSAGSVPVLLPLGLRRRRDRAARRPRARTRRHPLGGRQPLPRRLLLLPPQPAPQGAHAGGRGRLQPSGPAVLPPRGSRRRWPPSAATGTCRSGDPRSGGAAGPCTTRGKRATPRRRSCTTNGGTTYSSNRSRGRSSAPSATRPRSPSPAPFAPPASACRPSKAGPCSRIGTGARTCWWSTPPARCRTSCATDSPSAWGSHRAGSG